MPRKPKGQNTSQIYGSRMTTRQAAKTALYNMPQEIIDHIITLTQPDLWTAEACSLVSRAWRDSAQKIILSRIRVGDKISRQLRTFLSRKTSSRQLQRYATHFHYDISRCDYPKSVCVARNGHWSTQDTHTVDTIVRSLPHLTSLTLDVSISIVGHHPSLTPAMLDLLEKPEFQCFELRSGASFKFPRLCKYLQGSGRRRLYSVGTMLEMSIPTKDQDNDRGEVHPIELIIDGYSEGAATVTFASPAVVCLTGLRRLLLRFVVVMENPSSFIRSLRSALVEAKLLEELVIYIPGLVPVSVSARLMMFLDCTLSVQGHELPTLKNCPQLRSLDITLCKCDPERSSNEADGLLLVVELTRSIPTIAPLRSVFLEVGILGRTIDLMDSEVKPWQHKWTLLEQALLPTDADDFRITRPPRSLDLLYTDWCIDEVPYVASWFMPRLTQLGLLKLRSPHWCG